MGWIEDSVEEFRKLPTAGKIAVGGAAVGVAILAYAHYRANGGNAGSASVTGAFPGGVGIPSVTDGAGGVWTFPPTTQSGTGTPGGVISPPGLLGFPRGGRHPIDDIAPRLSSRSPIVAFPPTSARPPVGALPNFIQIAAAHVASSASMPA